jgi:hypothetical protein
MGYHVKPINKGQLGQFSKIREEFEEAQDAFEQGATIMLMCELADIIGAIECYLLYQHPTMTLADLLKMKDLTKKAFKDGDRR